MKINEVTQPSDRALFEAFDRDNKTGFATEDLVKIYRTHTNESWGNPMSADDILAEMDAWEQEATGK